ncbi:threonine/serine exporter family protein [Rhodopseudomonas sp. P2A-2r]|uniref:threonine/serine ThrE exporter family protein n=1 Tax=Rhodopseudomonas sp. P2A-2r TaxID=2991972 RepID=UPI002234AD33|nr:threonine/serine exporter family protein [Rhodopseudomonas sp. P2A-2r]UZE49850.1 threonine/serine exporter family protein [Rhodopseudomonas sp. P2A-2r]
MKLLIRVAQLLFVNGETTEGAHRTVERLGESLCTPVILTARWGDIRVQPDACTFGAQIPADPTAVDIGRVNATECLVDDIRLQRVTRDDAEQALDAISRMPPVSLLRFAVMAAAGAAALSVIFGAAHMSTIVLVAVSAGLGACARRGVSHLSRSPFLQPFVASLLAGAIVSLASVLHDPAPLHLLAACPCMVLVPGPHFLNGAIDLVRARIALGAARILFASLIVVAISAGLLIGLSISAARFAPTDAVAAVPLLYDVCAAGIAVAAYGVFFNMPWRMLALPIGIGMAAHALRWEMIDFGASAPLAAFAVCALVGCCMAPLSRRLRVPFGASSFAAVVSLIPGIFMFQTAADALSLIGHGSASAAVLTEIARNVVTASLILTAMTAGLIVPKMTFDYFATPARSFRRQERQPS